MATRTRRTAPKTATKAPAKRTPAKDPRTGRRFPANAAKKASAKKASASKAAKTVARGPSKATLDFAAKVVNLRDAKGLAWSEVAAKLGVPYDHNGSSRLRRAYTLGGGRTVGVRKAAK